MTRDDAEARRPERVIVVDADNPLQEIHGRFVWQDEHEAVVARVRQEGFEEGYRAGVDAAASSFVTRVPRWTRLGRALGLVVVVLLVLLVLLMLPIVLS